MITVAAILHSATVRHAAMGAVGGLLVAVRADRETFKAWQSWKDVRTFDWSIASFRYVKGAFIGAVSVSSIGAFFG